MEDNKANIVKNQIQKRIANIIKRNENEISTYICLDEDSKSQIEVSNAFVYHFGAFSFKGDSTKITVKPKDNNGKNNNKIIDKLDFFCTFIPCLGYLAVGVKIGSPRIVYNHNIEEEFKIDGTNTNVYIMNHYVVFTKKSKKTISEEILETKRSNTLDSWINSSPDIAAIEYSDEMLFVFKDNKRCNNINTENIYSLENAQNSHPEQVIYFGAPGTGKSHKIK